MIGTAIVILISLIFTGLMLAAIGTALFTFLPALAIFIGELWLSLFSAAVHALGVLLLLALIIFCASFIQLV